MATGIVCQPPRRLSRPSATLVQIKSHPDPSGWLEPRLRFVDFYFFFFAFFFAGFFFGILVPPCIKDCFYSTGRHPDLPAY
jgi:hypothetical protein